MRSHLTAFLRLPSGCALLRSALLLLLLAPLLSCRLVRDLADEHEMTALMRASNAGDVSEVERLLEDGARVNQSVRGHSALRHFIAFMAWMQQLPQRDPGYRALHYAAEGGHAEVARALLEGGADPNAVAGAGETALSLAAWTNDVGLIRVLLAGGASARRPPELASSAPWQSPLMMAALQGGQEVVRVLLDAGADPDGTPGSVSSPLEAATLRSRGAVTVALLLEHGADPEGSRGREAPGPLILAAQQGDLAAVRLLLAAGASATRRDPRSGWTAARWAASRGHDRVVAELSALAPEGARTESIELVRAVQAADGEAVRRLLAEGADPHTRTASGGSLLGVAVAAGSVEITRALLAAGADWRQVDRADIPHIQRAAQLGKLEVVEALLAAGSPGSQPGTATFAAGGGNLEVLKRLQAAGANLRESSDEPLRAAAIAGNVEAVRYLLSQGAVVDAADGNHRTALGRSVAFQQHGTVRALLEAGADARQRDPENGWTPLMSAAMAGDSLTITMLMAAGADPSVKDVQGKTAADHARGAGNAHVVPLLARGR